MTFGGAFDFLELSRQFLGFWFFIFSPKFRADTVRRWRARGVWGRLLIPFEVAVTVVCGTLPVWLAYLAFTI